MNVHDKVNFILQELDSLFPAPQFPLECKNDFTFLVAVMLSAQCTDATVNKVTKKLFAICDSPEKMISLGENRLKEIIRPCGFFNSKARAILETSKSILLKHNGAVPRTFQELEQLRGVGHKTASVVMSRYFNEPAFPVDTHISRLSNRWGLSGSKNVKIIENDLKSLFPENTWNKLHIQMILYGRKYCPARGHIIENCPICKKICQQCTHK